MSVKVALAYFLKGSHSTWRGSPRKAQCSSQAEDTEIGVWQGKVAIICGIEFLGGQSCTQKELKRSVKESS